MTIWPAWQHFEEDRKGSIEKGKLADFVILSDDPTAIDPESLADIRVLFTIKEDKIVHEAKSDARSGGDPTFLPVSTDPVAAHRLLHAMHDGLGAPRE